MIVWRAKVFGSDVQIELASFRMNFNFLLKWHFIEITHWIDENGVTIGKSIIWCTYSSHRTISISLIISLNGFHVRSGGNGKSSGQNCTVKLWSKLLLYTIPMHTRNYYGVLVIWPLVFYAVITWASYFFFLCFALLRGTWSMQMCSMN